MRLRMSLGRALVLGLSLALWSGAGIATGAEPGLADSITAGVVRTSEGFGSATVLVPSGGHVTYLVAAAPAMAGRTVEIWTRTRTTDWAAVTTRTLAADGTARYFARVAEWTGFWAKLPGEAGAGPVAVSHGRSATTSVDGSTRIRVWCEDFDAGAPGSVLVTRALAAPVGSLVTVTVCSNASTGYSWGEAAVSSGALTLVGHRAIPGPSAIGAAGSEAWTYRVTGRGAGHAVLAYSQPWTGGEKAAWLLVLRVN